MRSKIKGGSCKADKTQDQLNLFRAKLVSAKLLSKQLQSGKLLSVKLFSVKLSCDETIFSKMAVGEPFFLETFVQ